MQWDIPPKIKVAEALGTIADERIEVIGDIVRVHSSSGGKFYTVEYDADTNAIMCNDNASFFVGYLGYPAIAYLMKIGELDYSDEFAQALKGIRWKDVNQEYKNDFAKTEKYIEGVLSGRGIGSDTYKTFLEKVIKQIEKKKFRHLGKKKFPPKGY